MNKKIKECDLVGATSWNIVFCLVISLGYGKKNEMKSRQRSFYVCLIRNYCSSDTILFIMMWPERNNHHASSSVTPIRMRIKRSTKNEQKLNCTQMNSLGLSFRFTQTSNQTEKWRRKTLPCDLQLDVVFIVAMFWDNYNFLES